MAMESFFFQIISRKPWIRFENNCEISQTMEEWNPIAAEMKVQNINKMVKNVFFFRGWLLWIVNRQKLASKFIIIAI